MNTNTQIVTRKITIKPTFSPRKEWVKRVKEFTIKELEDKIIDILIDLFIWEKRRKNEADDLQKLWTL